MTGRVHYVYGVVGASLETVTAPKGIEGGAVTLVRNGDVAALTTSLNADDYAPEKVEALTANVDWVSDRAIAHDRWTRIHRPRLRAGRSAQGSSGGA